MPENSNILTEPEPIELTAQWKFKKASKELGEGTIKSLREAMIKDDPDMVVGIEKLFADFSIGIKVLNFYRIDFRDQKLMEKLLIAFKKVDIEIIDFDLVKIYQSIVTASDNGDLTSPYTILRRFSIISRNRGHQVITVASNLGPTSRRGQVSGAAASIVSRNINQGN